LCQNRSSGIHQGANKGTTDLSYISHLERIRVGDMVLSNGEGLIFPAGFAWGTIQSAQQGDLFYTVVVNLQLIFHRYAIVCWPLKRICDNQSRIPMLLLFSTHSIFPKMSAFCLKNFVALNNDPVSSISFVVRA